MRLASLQRVSVRAKVPRSVDVPMTDDSSIAARMRAALATPQLRLLAPVAVAMGALAVATRLSPAVGQARDAARDLATGLLAFSPWLQDVLRPSIHYILLSPGFYCLLSGLLCLEILLPAQREQRPLSPALLNDWLWALLQLSFFATAAGAFGGLLEHRLWPLLGLPVVPLGDHLPGPLHLLSVILIVDFLEWLHHLIRHKVPVLWAFHTIHHSQRSLNPMTDARYHVVEYFVASLVMFIPGTLLDLGAESMTAWLVARSWYTRFYHGNIRLTLGPLRYVLVTPQSHRIHHSRLPEHRDRNMGVLLCVWDRLFGTHSDDPRYPETGIEDDQGFPHDRSARQVLSLRPLLMQQLYPFVYIARLRRAPR